MGEKQSNEITLKIKNNVKDFEDILKHKKFNVIDEFTLDDTYLIPKKLEIENVDYPITEEVLDFIASHFNTDVRELEGSLKRLLFYHINLNLARVLLTFFDFCGIIIRIL